MCQCCLSSSIHPSWWRVRRWTAVTVTKFHCLAFSLLVASSPRTGTVMRFHCLTFLLRGGEFTVDCCSTVLHSSFLVASSPLDCCHCHPLYCLTFLLPGCEFTVDCCSTVLHSSFLVASSPLDCCHCHMVPLSCILLPTSPALLAVPWAFLSHPFLKSNCDLNGAIAVCSTVDSAHITKMKNA